MPWNSTLFICMTWKRLQKWRVLSLEPVESIVCPIWTDREHTLYMFSSETAPSHCCQSKEALLEKLESTSKKVLPFGGAEQFASHARRLLMPFVYLCEFNFHKRWRDLSAGLRAPWLHLGIQFRGTLLSDTRSQKYLDMHTYPVHNKIDSSCMTLSHASTARSSRHGEVESCFKPRDGH